MLNPSTADATTDDPTIRRCVGFAKQWGCGTLIVVNLFAFRATSPGDMKRESDPVGPDNDAWIRGAVRQEGAIVVCAWGVHGDFAGRDKVVASAIHDTGVRVQCLGYTKGGHPRHPLMLASKTQLEPYWSRVCEAPDETILRRGITKREFAGG